MLQLLKKTVFFNCLYFYEKETLLITKTVYTIKKMVHYHHSIIPITLTSRTAVSNKWPSRGSDAARKHLKILHFI